MGHCSMGFITVLVRFRIEGHLLCTATTENLAYDPDARYPWSDKP